MPSRSRTRSSSRSRSPAARSRSRSRSRRSRSRSARSRTRSRSRSFNRSRRRDSRSPMSNRRRHVGNREDPAPSKCIGVFGLSLHTTERQLDKEFGKFGNMEKVQVVLDGHSGRSRGFGFIYYESEHDAADAKREMNGTELDGKKIRVDFSITKRAHTPTPGMYMGRPTGGRSRAERTGRTNSRDRDERGYDRGGGYDRGYGDRDYERRRRSPSPRYSRHRSRSYSPAPRYRSERY